jgi:DNA-binding NtrC family response regulator
VITKIQGLLVYERDDRFLILRSALDGLGVTTRRAKSCYQAGTLLCDTPPPHLVFTDTVLPDGNWMDMLDLAAKARQRVNLIVVSPRADINLYIDVMNRGAFDYITESFTVPEIVFVVRSGIENALHARQDPRKSLRRPQGSSPMSKECDLEEEEFNGAHA